MRLGLWLAVLLAPAGGGTPAAAKPAQPHRYIYSEDDVYYYGAALSPEQLKRGDYGQEAVGYRYLGKNYADELVLGEVGSDGKIKRYFACRRPCTVIRTSDAGRIVASPNLVVVSAFRDAEAGALRSSYPFQAFPSGSPLPGIPVAFSMVYGTELRIPISANATAVATAPGRVVFSGALPGRGFVVKLDHGAKFETVYSGLSSVEVKVGWTVNKGDAVGTVDYQPEPAQALMLYEVRVSGSPIDPWPYVRDK